VSGPRRVVFDTSSLIGAALRIGSSPDKALALGLLGWEVCASAETLAELEKVLERRKFDRYLSRDSRRAFVSLLRQRANVWSGWVADSSDLKPPCRDPQDNKFLALALAVRAEVLVSSDKDLLVLHPWQGISIMTPSGFVLLGEPVKLARRLRAAPIVPGSPG
jgi:putative PIN family toxin of toxin-antitoxin system